MLNFEQEFQTVVGHARIDGGEVEMERVSLTGDRLSFALREPGTRREMTYQCRIEGEQMRGTARSAGKTPRTFELRARREVAVG